jgi:quinol monooxygenase YgiN
MHRYLLAAVLMTAGLLSSGQMASAQDAAQPVYIVTYMEVVPSSAAEARKLLLGYAKDTRKAADLVQIDALQRISDSNHFALIEQWKSLAAKQAYAATEPVTKFRAAFTPLQSAAYDERIHAGFSVGPAVPASGNQILFLTHVDIIPTQVEPGTAKVKSFADAGRGAKGNRRFDDLIQSSRKNHFTLVESWDAATAKNAWISTDTARTFRQELQPISGGLYDERAYKLLR